MLPMLCETPQSSGNTPVLLYRCSFCCMRHCAAPLVELCICWWWPVDMLVGTTGAALVLKRSPAEASGRGRALCAAGAAHAQYICVMHARRSTDPVADALAGKLGSALAAHAERPALPSNPAIRSHPVPPDAARCKEGGTTREPDGAVPYLGPLSLATVSFWVRGWGATARWHDCDASIPAAITPETISTMAR